MTAIEPMARAAGHAEIRELVDQMERAAIWLSRSPGVRSASAHLEKVMAEGDATAVPDAADALVRSMRSIKELTSTKDGIDPHILDEAELDRLWALEPTRLVREAVLEGRLRERRILLQAIEAETNRRLARYALLAAMAATFAALVALIVPFLPGV